MRLVFLLLSWFTLPALASTAPPAARPILMVTGMKDEADLVRANGIINVIGAMNPAQLRDSLKPYNAGNVRAVVSFGIAGALTPDLTPGTMVIPNQVVSKTGKMNVDAGLASSIVTILKNANALNLHTDAVYADDAMAGVDPKSRAQIHQQTGAGISDTESHIVAEFAAAQGIPFVVVRAVADPSDFTLPPAALLPLNPDGTPNMDAIQNSIDNDPSQISALMQLNKYNKSAMASLKWIQDKVHFENWDLQRSILALSGR